MKFIREKAIAIVFNRMTNYVLIGFVFASVISYIYFANMAVRTLTTLERVKEEAQSISVEVSEMESKRLAIDNTVSSDLARHLGFVEVSDQTFIVNKSKKTALSLKID